MEKVIKKGIVLANLITLKKGGYLPASKVVTSEDVNGFDELVASGKIEVDEDSIKQYKAAQQKQAETAKQVEKERKEKVELAKKADSESVKLLADANKEVETLKKENDVLKGDGVKLADANKEVETLKVEVVKVPNLEKQLSEANEEIKALKAQVEMLKKPVTKK